MANKVFLIIESLGQKHILSRRVSLIPQNAGFFVITERGKQALSQNPEKIDVKFLEQFPEFTEFKQIKSN